MDQGVNNHNEKTAEHHMNWVYQSAVSQRAALQRGEISSLELLEMTISHTEELTPYLNPIALRLYERAREAALAADKIMAKGKGGPLCGLPVTIKDSQWLAGYRCANGSLTLKDHIPQETSQAVQRLEDAGAVIFAKTTCPEFSLSGITESEIYGRTSNPWSLSRTPGGSSGGAGTAVAAGMGSLALAGDGGGSIRIPAAFCGVTGFKPGYGMIPRKPGFSTWESIVSYGPMARNVEDTQLMYSVLSNTETEEADEPDGKPESSVTLIASEHLGFAPVDDDVKLAFREALYRIRSAGHTVKVSHPGLTSSVATWAITATHDMWKHKTESLENISELGEYAQGFIDFGGSFTETDFEDAQIRRTQIHDAYMEMFKRNRSRILITPTLGCEAFSHGSIHPLTIGSKEITYPWLDWAGFLYDANLAGMPACSIPMGLGGEGLPIGLQVMGAPGSELEVLRVARTIEQLLDWEQSEFDSQSFSNSIEIPAVSSVDSRYFAPAESVEVFVY